MTPKPIIVVTSAAFRPERKAALDRLLAELRPQCNAVGVPLLVHEDHEGKGSLGPWLHVLAEGAAWPDVTHVTYLPDDAILVPHFIEVLLACIEAQPEAVLCFQSNHLDAPKAYEAGARWYTTPDGFTAFGGTMPVQWVREHLEWRRTMLRPDVLVQGDEGVNLWAMATGRRIYKSLPSLVDHDLTIPSADGNDADIHKSARRPLVWDAEADLRRIDWGGQVVTLGRTYRGNHWRLVTDVREDKHDAALIEAMYTAARGGRPVSSTPVVSICSPTYRESHEIVRATAASKKAVTVDLLSHGIGVTRTKASGDSLPQRMRQRAVHQFLKSEATHLLWWDADVECVDPTVVRTMLESGHDVVCGAYPFKDTTGRVVMNLWDADVQRFEGGAAVPEWLEVEHAGTGFMLVSRRVLVDLMARHPELLHLSMSRDDDRGAPLWAIYDTAIVDMVYLSEDYFFCRLVHDAGGKVWVYTPARFRHYGVAGYEGSVQEQFAQIPESA